MDSMQRLSASDLVYLLPELVLVGAAVLLTLLDLFLPKSAGRHTIGVLALVSLLVSGFFAFQQLGMENPVSLLSGSFRVDDFSALFKLILLGSTAFIVLLGLGQEEKQGIVHRGEFYYLLLPAVLGGMVMASSADMITMFVGLETLSISSYVLVALAKQKTVSNEGAYKYVVMGGISTAFILYGMSFLYGLSGSTHLGQINAALAQHGGSYELLIYVSFFLLLTGFGFKIAAAPFHAWAPDVYQGAPTPVAAFLAVVSKGAAIALMFRFLFNVYYGIVDPNVSALENDFFLAIGVLAAAAMIIGNAMALKQTNAKRLLALSGVANAGYLLVPIAAHFNTIHFSNAAEMMYYLIAYALMNIGAFALLMIVSSSAGHEELRGFAGLYHRAPWTAIAGVLIVISLAGLPISGGFFGKLFIMFGTMQVQKYWLAAIMIVTSVASFYYYFGLIRQMFMRPGDDAQEVRVPWNLGAVLWIMALGGLLLGLFPQWVLTALNDLIALSVDLFER
ncbi:NADH-quinone oxidoreductase subunit N [Paenibacillus turpanensis]|uniref:NADH-quinone oxidoreductase subunit N n=1 Tax=Paenibacillus turpanensis TaxID=2689078 RepID=UPI0014084D19|nr:NADH-quinone oxidoreductase subunit N [Paenibacillus turpanensis]